eukprot:TRINITY_DN1168_c0_g1_i1.p1 TRINITY_DN1168_c0_g1~~TRINITY_DN1168_c0_g1_i1.p1  ORF type:complete len:378 (+),score=195.54 TRINITY_DN1168_c0_g1_i1:152-1285(+)
MSSTIIKLCHGDDTRRVALSAVSFAELSATARARFSLADSFKLTYVDEDGDAITVASDAELAECVRSHAGRVPKLTVNGAVKAAPAPAPAAAAEPAQQAPQQPANPFEEIFAELSSVPAKLLTAMKASPEAQAFASELGVDLAAADDWQNVAAQVEASDKVKSKLEEVGKQFEAMMEAESNNNNNDDSNADNADALPVHMATCDSCSERIRGVRHKCLDCADFDFCSACLPRKDAEHNPAHSFLAIERPAAAACRNRFTCVPSTPTLHARLVEDVTAAAGAVARGDAFTKVFVLENCGAAPWRQVRARWVGGDRAGLPLSVRVSDAPVAVGERVHVVVDGQVAGDHAGDVVKSRLQLIDARSVPIVGGDITIEMKVL